MGTEEARVEGQENNKTTHLYFLMSSGPSGCASQPRAGKRRTSLS